MYSLKSFLEPRVKAIPVIEKVAAPIVTETTIEPHHEEQADNWDHHGEVNSETSGKIESAFGGKDFTHFPLSSDSHSSVDPDVGEHLSNHGYDIKDYRKGIVSKKTIVGNPALGIPHREKVVEEKIGSVLDKTRASDAVKKAYMNDPSRTAFKSSVLSGGHHVVISTHPYAIAGSSTGTSWRSCMNMDDGSYSHHLSSDSKTGTHVAFLVNHDDPTAFKTGLPSNPLARTMLKAHHDEDTGDTIYRPESRSYGSAGGNFHHAVSSWATQNYPAKTDTTYHKNSSLYDDDNVSTYKSTSPQTAEKNLKGGLSIYHDMGRARPSLDHDTVTHAVHVASEMIKNPETHPVSKQYVLSHVLEIPNLNSHHVAKIRHSVKQHDFGDFDANRQIAITHGDKLSSAAIHEQYTSKPDEVVPNKVLMNTKLPDSIVDRLESSKYNFVHRSKLKDKHYDRIVDANINDGTSIQPHADHLSSTHLSKLITGNKYTERDTGSGLRAGYSPIPHMSILSAKNFNQEHHDQLVDAAKATGDSHIVNAVLGGSKFASPKDFDKLGHTDFNHALMSGNDNISNETGKYLKNKFIERVKSSPEPTDRGSMLNPEKSNGYKDRYTVGNYGFGNSKQPRIKEAVSKHITEDDYSEIAKKGKVPLFKNPGHSSKMLDAYLKHAKVHDSIMDDHITRKTKEADENGEEYHEDDDPSAAPKRASYHTHMARYGSAVEDHLNEHADDGNGTIKSETAKDQVAHHLGAVDDLEHYKTRNNSSRHDDIDHWSEHFGDTADSYDNLYARGDHFW